MYKHIFLSFFILFTSGQLGANMERAPFSRTITFGILSHGTKAQMTYEWGHVKKALENSMERVKIDFKILDIKQLTNAVESKNIDFILTNPAHYMILKKNYGLSNPIATLVNKSINKSVNIFGGVMFTRKSNIFLKDFNDFTSKKIAITDKESFGGYQMQAYELYKKKILLKDSQLMALGMPHENVVKAVSSQLADIGFVRTGVLEAMEKQGKIVLSDYEIIHPKQFENFDFLSSTSLYTEWPLSVVSGINQDTIRETLSNLLILDKFPNISGNVSFCCFGIPGDYAHTEKILKEMGYPPFHGSKHLSLLEFWEKHKIEISVFLLITGLFLLIILWRFIKATIELRESEERFQKLHNASFGGIAIHDQGKILDCNQGLEELFGYTRVELLNMNGLLLIAPWHREVVLKKIKNKFEEPYEVVCIKKDGVTFPARIEAREIPYKGKSLRVVELRDISTQKKAEEKLELAAKVFTHTREAILITDTNGDIIDVNQSFTYITGYSKNEILGKNPRVLKSGKHDKEFYKKMWTELQEKGHWYGEIWNKRKNGELYIEMINITSITDDNGVVRQYLSIFSDITTLKEHEKELEHMAHYDALTSLPNRLLLRDRLEQTIMNSRRTGLKVCIAYLDLDGFKIVNDGYGHEIGDKFLVDISNKLKLTLREGDTVSRLGGDEFVVVMQNLSDETMSIPMLERLLDAASSPSAINDILLKVSASIGATFYPQAEDIDADSLLRQADQAMYKAKVSGKNRYCIFDSLEDKTIRGYHQSIDNIKRAIDNDEFTLHYQPKINMSSGDVIGFEALIRWIHPNEGILYPGEFLPTLEKHPIELEVGDWVLRKALNQMRIWKLEGFDISVSVNMGARQLQQSGFSLYLKNLFVEFSEISPSKLQIELLETSALEELAKVSATIKECQKFGVSFALDDFGTGYSSLAYLKQLPVEVLKIDQSFVRDMLDDPNDLAIIEGIINLAKAFRHLAIAEGVETQEDGVVLKKLGCKYVQGYYIAKPMPSNQVTQWLKDWQIDPIWVKTDTMIQDEYPLLFALVDHGAWINAVINQGLFLGEESLEIAFDQCNFGKWFYAESHKYFDKDTVEYIDVLHKKIHHLAYQFLHNAKKDEEKSIELIGEIKKHSSQLLQKMLIK